MKKLLAIFSILVLATVSYLAWILITLPDVRHLVQTNPKTTALMEQRAEENGTKLQPLRSWTPYKESPFTCVMRFWCPKTAHSSSIPF
jgi:hypothetical protein